MSKHSLLYLLLILSLGCSRREISEPATEPGYRLEIESWRAERLAELTAPDGWPTLVGLFKLKEGRNTFGSAPNNDLVFPAKAPAFMGRISVEGDSAVIEMAEGLTVSRRDSLVRQTALSAQTPVELTFESLSWHLIERGGQLFLRLRDTLHPARYALDSLPYFPIDPQWRVRARFVPFDPPRNLPVRNVLDMDIDQQCEGKLQFEIDGQTHEIWTLDGGEEEFFLIIADLTTGEETYGGGRYLYVSRPDSTGHTVIDFNKAYNPPCVFTKYATCLLPPAQNRLELAVRAGEKMYGDLH